MAADLYPRRDLRQHAAWTSVAGRASARSADGDSPSPAGPASPPKWNRGRFYHAARASAASGLCCCRGDIPLIKDLAETSGNIQTTAKVCIIGAGIAGLLTGWRLSTKGIPVILLESGPRNATDAVHPLNVVEQLGQNYKGATRGRFRCLGGTSTRWGGQLVPIPRNAMEPRPYIGLPGWPLSPGELLGYLPEVES